MGEQQSEQWNFTAEELIERAERRERRYRSFKIVVFTIIAPVIVAIFGLLPPVHAWIQTHLAFSFGIVVGTIVGTLPWARWRWQKGDRP